MSSRSESRPATRRSRTWRTRLAAVRWPERETASDWSQGVPLDYLRELVVYWRERYDWRARERRINRFPQFLVRVGRPGDSLPARALAAPARRAAAPHARLARLDRRVPERDRSADGARGAWWRARRCVSRRVPVAAGLRVLRQAATARLRCRTDRESSGTSSWSRSATSSYFAQGGDWGAAVTTQIGVQNRGHCRGIHLNLPIAPPPEGRSREPDAAGAGGLRGDPALCGARIRLRRPAEHAAADDRLRAGRFARRAVRVDHREVQDLDRQRRLAGKRRLARRAARQRHDVLADRERRLVGSAVLGELPFELRPGPAAGDPADGLQPVREGAREAAAGVGASADTPTSCTGTSCRRAGTSPPSSSPSLFVDELARASARCVERQRPVVSTTRPGGAAIEQQPLGAPACSSGKRAVISGRRRPCS